MNHIVRGSSIVAALSLGASMLAHLAGYRGLDRLASMEPPRERPPVEFTLVSDSGEEAPAKEEAEPTPTEAAAAPASASAPAERTTTPDDSDAVPTDEEPPLEPPPPVEPPAEPLPPLPEPPPLLNPAPPQLESRPAAPAPEPMEMRLPDRIHEDTPVIQHSDDPDVPPPEDARFVADENRMVDEETVATETSVDSDDVETLASTDDPSSTDAPGRVGQPEDTPEATTAHPTPEASTPSLVDAPADVRRVEARLPSTSPDPRRAAAPRDAVAGREAVMATPELPSRESDAVPDTEIIEMTDADGTWTVEVPRAADPSRGAAGRDGARARAPVRLRLGYAAMEDAVGREELEAARGMARAEREAAGSATRRGERMAQFRFAAENFVGSVRPGNQTALRTRAAPYASWISSVHRRIHGYFAEEFLVHLPESTGPLANPELYAEYEFVVDPTGHVVTVGRRRTSGQVVFDLGAFNAILDAQPYPEPPTAIRSGDGNTYVIWGFSRNREHACHSSQARPYVLPNPPPIRPMPGVQMPRLPRGPAAEPPIDDRELPDEFPADDPSPADGPPPTDAPADVPGAPRVPAPPPDEPEGTAPREPAGTRPGGPPSTRPEPAP